MATAQPGLLFLSHKVKSLLIFEIIESGNACASVPTETSKFDIRNSIKLLVAFMTLILVEIRDYYTKYMLFAQHLDYRCQFTTIERALDHRLSVCQRK